MSVIESVSLAPLFQLCYRYCVMVAMAMPIASILTLLFSLFVVSSLRFFRIHHRQKEFMNTEDLHTGIVIMIEETTQDADYEKLRYP